MLTRRHGTAVTDVINWLKWLQLMCKKQKNKNRRLEYGTLTSIRVITRQIRTVINFRSFQCFPRCRTAPFFFFCAQRSATLKTTEDNVTSQSRRQKQAAVSGYPLARGRGRGEAVWKLERLVARRHVSPSPDEIGQHNDKDKNEQGNSHSYGNKEALRLAILSWRGSGENREVNVLEGCKNVKFYVKMNPMTLEKKNKKHKTHPGTRKRKPAGGVWEEHKKGRRPQNQL